MNNQNLKQNYTTFIVIAIVIIVIVACCLFSSIGSGIYIYLKKNFLNNNESTPSNENISEKNISEKNNSDVLVVETNKEPKILTNEIPAVNDDVKLTDDVKLVDDVKLIDDDKLTDSNQINFLGCYKDTDDRALSTYHGVRTLDECRDIALKLGENVFGMQSPQGDNNNATAECRTTGKYDKYGPLDCGSYENNGMNMGDTYMNAVYKIN